MTAYRPAPRSKASALIERLSRVTASGFNEVAVRRLEQDARRLMAADAVGAHTVLGGAAALRWDVEAVHDHYRIALQHLATAETYYNYSIALQNVEETDSAFEASANAQQSVPDDKFLLDHAVGLALQAGHFAAGQRLCERWNALVPAESHALTWRIERLTAATAEGRFSERAVRRVLATLRSVQQDERVPGVASATMEDPREPGAFLHEQHVRATPTDAERLNARFVEAVVGQPELVEDPGFGFVAVFVGTDT